MQTNSTESWNVLKLRGLILNTRKPLILKNFKPQWKCCEGKIENWCQLFDAGQNGKPMEFEEMSINSDTGHPQWERERRKVNITMNQFLQRYQNGNKNSWAGLNYQTPDDIPKECTKGVNFDCFGFSHLTEDYGRFWLSSKGANTPCHQDTYGCNIVVQVFGSKLWLLFPPNTPLTSTRLPYEESSIYCLENFYAPNLKQVEDLRSFKENAYICRLEAGDVLIVPRHWWHFVEAESLSLSINAWIPLNVDINAQLEECVVKYLIELIVKQESESGKNYILNPNHRDLCSDTDIFELLKFLITKLNSFDYDKDCKRKNTTYPYQYLDEAEVKRLLNEFPNACIVEKAKSSEYEALIQSNSKRFVPKKENKEAPVSFIKDALINSLCSGNVVKAIIKEFQGRIKVNSIE